MKCFEDARGGTSREAVAVCSACGAALCEEHLVEQAIEQHPQGLIGTRGRGRLILCAACA